MQCCSKTQTRLDAHNEEVERVGEGVAQVTLPALNLPVQYEVWEASAR